MKNWDEYFMDIAKLVSTRSKDRSTKVGALVVRDKTILSTGYNGFPRGVDDTIEERYERPLKYVWTVHAEENALLHAAREGISINGSTMYVTLHPCSTCAKAIVQCGIKEVVVEDDDNPRFAEDFKVAKTILEEAGVTIRHR